MRGVHLIKKTNESLQKGSSPHARGPRLQAMRKGMQLRIIPACAGSTLVVVRYSLPAQDHPRMRGVHRSRIFSVSRALGSSPHARGPLFTLPAVGAMVRIIPACAGSTIYSRKEERKQ